jgi:hypothetical protein
MGMPGLLKAGEMIGSPLGSFVYHLLVLLAVEAAFGMALGEWRHAHDERALRSRGIVGPERIGSPRDVACPP